MCKLNEIIPAQLGNGRSALEKGKPVAVKSMMHVKGENSSEVLIYNGINDYIFQAILKELLSNAL